MRGCEELDHHRGSKRWSENARLTNQCLDKEMAYRKLRGIWETWTNGY